MIQETKRILGELRWSGVLGSLDLRMAEATNHSWGHAEFLSAIVTDEKTYRDNRRITKRLQIAKFRQNAYLEKIDYSFKRTLSKTQVQDLAQLQFLQAQSIRNVCIIGPTGVGKTFLATALGHHACQRGYTTLFFGMHHFIEQILLSRSDGSFLRFRQRVIQSDLLILDDIGLKALAPLIVQDFYDILEERYNKKGTVITSQLPLSNWKEIIEDPLILEAIIDRILHPSILLEITGDSIRKQKK